MRTYTDNIHVYSEKHKITQTHIFLEIKSIPIPQIPIFPTGFSLAFYNSYLDVSLPQ